MIPQNEMGVIVLFSQKAELAGVEILEIGASYPDAKIRRNSIDYLVEFEYRSSNFVLHGHDIRKCDLIICWEDDYQDIALPVVELSKEDWVQADFIALSQIEKEAFYWKQRALAAERKLKELPPVLSTDSLSHQTPKGKVADTRQRIIQAMQANPKLNSKEIADLIGVSSGRVRQIRQLLVKTNGNGNHQ